MHIANDWMKRMGSMAAVTPDLPELTVTVEDEVALVRLNRPEHRNAFNSAMTNDLLDMVERLDDDPSVRAIVVTGNGRYFSAGAELVDDDVFSDEDNHRQEWRVSPSAGRRWPWEMSTPVLAAMNGPAVGMGLTLTLQYDIRVMAEDAKYGFVFTRRGVIPELNSSWLLPRIVGVANAADLLLSGRLFDGREARMMGMAMRALPADEVLPFTLDYARELVRHTSPAAVALAKRHLYSFLDADADSAHQREFDAFDVVGRMSDAKEGINSFLEKRDPRWVSSKTDAAEIVVSGMGGAAS